MMRLESVIGSLVAQSVANLKLEAPRRLLSLYVPYDHSAKQTDLTTLVNSLTSGSLKERLPELTDGQKNQIKATVQDLLPDPTTKAGGIALFVELESDDTRESVKDFQRIELAFTPWPSATLSRGYNLMQLLHFYHHYQEILVVDLARAGAQVYLTNNLAIDKLESLFSIETPYVYSDPKQTLNNFSPARGSGTQFSAGDHKLNRSDEQADLKFAYSVVDKINDYLSQNQNKINSIIFLASEYFFKSADKIKSRLHANHLKIDFKQANPVDEQQIKSLAAAVIAEAEEESHADVKSALAEEPNRFARDWAAVSEALRNGRASKLFLPHTEEHVGCFVLSGDQLSVYTEPQENASPTAYLPLWACINAWQQNTLVHVWDDEAVAELRY